MKLTIFSKPIKTIAQSILVLAILSFSFGAANASIEQVAALSPAPVNDNFANANTKLIDTVPYADTLDTTGAADAGDGPAVPGLCDGKSLRKGIKNVWYQYMPTADKLVYIDTFGSTAPSPSDSYDTYIAVWTGIDINNLTLIGCDDDNPDGFQSQLSLQALQGVTYYIEIAQYNGELPNEPPKTPTGGMLHLHITSFEDVPGDYWAWRYIEGLYQVGITSGCGLNPVQYCPETTVTRDQMAVFLLKAKYGSGHVPPAPAGMFQDVPIDYWAAAWIEELATEGITSGCSISPKLYCPTITVTRDQMAVFLLKAEHGSGYIPPAATGIFQDVATDYWAATWIERLAAEGITGGCSVTPKLYCPTVAANRAQMAVFLDKTFSIPILP